MTTFQEGDLLRIYWKIQLLSLSRVVWRARAPIVLVVWSLAVFSQWVYVSVFGGLHFINDPWLDLQRAVYKSAILHRNMYANVHFA